MRLLWRIVFAGLFTGLLTTVSLRAQTAPNFENGWKPYGSYDGSHLDTVNLMNGNLMLHAPLLPDLAQRGTTMVGETLYITSKDWQTVCTPNPSIPSGMGCKWERGGTGVNILVTPAITVHRTLNKQYTSGEGITTYVAYGYTVTAPDGSTHQMEGVAGSEDSNGAPTKFNSLDLTGYHLEMSNPDANGISNTFTITYDHGPSREPVWGRDRSATGLWQGANQPASEGWQFCADDRRQPNG
jgi:hypothetical protein